MNQLHRIYRMVILSGLLLGLAPGCPNQPPANSGILAPAEKKPPEDNGPPPSDHVPHFDGYSGSVDTAISDYTNAIDRYDPEGFYHAQRAVAWHAKGDYAKADKDFKAAIEILAGESTRHLDYAWFLATCPDDKYRDGERAVEHAIRYFELATDWVYKQPGNYREHGDKAIRIAVSNNRLGGGMSSLFMKGWNWESLETIAASFAELGEFDRAVKWQQLALDSFVHDGAPIGHLTKNDMDQMNARLALYKQEQPLRITARTKH